jgi:hypothetical protein
MHTQRRMRTQCRHALGSKASCPCVRCAHTQWSWQPQTAELPTMQQLLNTGPISRVTQQTSCASTHHTEPSAAPNTTRCRRGTTVSLAGASSKQRKTSPHIDAFSLPNRSSRNAFRQKPHGQRGAAPALAQPCGPGLAWTGTSTVPASEGCGRWWLNHPFHGTTIGLSIDRTAARRTQTNKADGPRHTVSAGERAHQAREGEAKIGAATSVDQSF